VAEVIAGHWRGGLRALGLAEGAVGLSPLRQLLPGQAARLETVTNLLAAGSLTTGA